MGDAQEKLPGEPASGESGLPQRAFLVFHRSDGNRVFSISYAQLQSWFPKAKWVEANLSLLSLPASSCEERNFMKQSRRYKTGKLLEHQVTVLEYREVI
jgi:hypothetical protein